MKIVILGGGPCALGAAWRLAEINHPEWKLFEKNGYWGGLSASFQDAMGFWWDVGGHVLFSHYTYFDQVMDTLLGKEDGWVFHKREAWIRIQNRFVPYPLQNNIHRLSKQAYWECLEGIIDIHRIYYPTEPANFKDWILRTMGKGIAKWFMIPYNFKVWAYPPEMLDWSWVGDRVSPIDLKSVLKHAVFATDDIEWGPNSTFRFPRYGATGSIWRTLANRLPPQNLFLNKKAVRLFVKDKKVQFEDDSIEAYDILLTTIPLTDVIRISALPSPYDQVPDLKYSSVHIVGLAIKGALPDHLVKKCWMYFPEDNCPFYRVTVFSNYSPNNVPDSSQYWSLMCEVSESCMKPVNKERVIDDVIDGAVQAGLLPDKKQISHTWHQLVVYGYPTPSLNRNALLFPVLRYLEENGIYSRGRFGAWRYEVGNMDHSFMQGVEFVNRICGHGEELTLWYPQVVNTNHPSGRKR